MKKMRELVQRVYTYMRPYRFALYAAIFCTLLAILLNTFLPFLIGLPTSEIQRNVQANEAIHFAYIGRVLLIIVATGVAYAIAQFLSNFLMTKVVQGAMFDLRAAIEKKMNRLPVSYFDKHQRGDLLSRVTNDVDTVSNALQQSFLQVISAFVGIILAVSAMFLINVKMALISLWMIPASMIISRIIVKLSQKYFKEQQQALGNLTGFIQENMTAFSVIKLFGREEQTQADFGQHNQNLAQAGFKSAAISGLMMPLVQLTSYSTYIGITLLGSLYILQGILLIGQLQAFIQYIWQVNQPLGQLTQLSGLIQSASAATGRIFELLDEPEEHNPDHVNTWEVGQITGAVSFQHVHFRYKPDQPLIEDFSATVQPGQMVAIVGPTGAGKTTLINLLMRFYDWQAGDITIDGMNLKAMSRQDVRQAFGMVLQDAWLYEGTVMENIRFGRLHATDEEVIAAAKLANVDHFIRTLPDGYQMEVNEEGSNISLGQKQLLTIARVLVANPKILILDEATSSVDTRMERLIQEAMTRVMKGRTSFVIAHRLSTIKDADVILVLNQGNIEEQGTHQELMERKGFYYDLYQSQFAHQE